MFAAIVIRHPDARRFLTWSAALALMSILAGCEGDTPATPAVEPVATIAITPPPAEVLVGASIPLSAQLRSADGEVLTGRAVA